MLSWRQAELRIRCLPCVAVTEITTKGLDEPFARLVTGMTTSHTQARKTNPEKSPAGVEKTSASNSLTQRRRERREPQSFFFNHGWTRIRARREFRELSRIQSAIIPAMRGKHGAFLFSIRVHLCPSVVKNLPPARPWTNQKALTGHGRGASCPRSQAGGKGQGVSDFGFSRQKTSNDKVSLSE